MRSAQMKMIIGCVMRELRESRGVSLSHAAQRSGWSKGHLSRVERGITKPSLALVRWYDAVFDAGEVLIRQFVELEEAAREDRVRTLEDAREGRRARDGTGGTVPADYDPRDLCLLVSETVPDGTPTCARFTFVKTWTVRNGGPVPWTRRWLTRQGHPGVPGWLQSPKMVPVPDTAPGQEVVIAVTLRTSTWTGASIAYFKMTDAAGHPYFPGTDAHPLYCTVQVTL